jgi:hypothetical protein
MPLVWGGFQLETVVGVRQWHTDCERRESVRVLVQPNGCKTRRALECRRLPHKSANFFYLSAKQYPIFHLPVGKPANSETIGLGVADG